LIKVMLARHQAPVVDQDKQQVLDGMDMQSG
jgi:hypothetical protein